MDSQRLKARGMISDPGLKQMVGQKGVPKPRRAAQATLAHGTPVPLAKGGRVKGDAIQAMENKAMEMQESRADKKQDKSMMARHNRLMHPGQKSKLAKGGKAGCKMAAGGAAKVRKGVMKGNHAPKAGKAAAYE